MDTAFCLEDSTLWDARLLDSQAKKQPEEWLQNRRQAFICCSCERKAKFVRSQKRNPHFAIVQGNEHAEDCDFRANPSSRDQGPGTPLPGRDPAQGNKEIRYAEPGPLNPAADGGSGGPSNGSGDGGNHHVGDAPLHETTGLKSLLKNLRNRDDYPPENLWLDVPVRGPAVRATDYFQRIGELTPQTETDDVTRAYWGYIHLTNDGSGMGGKETLWIYVDRIGSVFAIRMGYDVKDQLYQAMGIQDSSALDGCHVIVEGIMNKGKKLSVSVNDITKIAFLPKR